LNLGAERRHRGTVPGLFAWAAPWVFESLARCPDCSWLRAPIRADPGDTLLTFPLIKLTRRRFITWVRSVASRLGASPQQRNRLALFSRKPHGSGGFRALLFAAQANGEDGKTAMSRKHATTFLTKRNRFVASCSGAKGNEKPTTRFQKPKSIAE
jgi:hypothetical protein